MLKREQFELHFCLAMHEVIDRWCAEHDDEATGDWIVQAICAVAGELAGGAPHDIKAELLADCMRVFLTMSGARIEQLTVDKTKRPTTTKH